MKNFKNYLYNEVPMPLESIPKSVLDPEIYAIAQAKKKGEKAKLGYNILAKNSEIAKNLKTELEEFFSSTIEEIKNIKVENIDFSSDVSPETRQVKFKDSKFNKKYKLMLQLFNTSESAVELIENNFTSGQKLLQLKNKAALDIKKLEQKIKNLNADARKISVSKDLETTKRKQAIAKRSAIELQAQIAGETTDEIREGISKTNVGMNSMLYSVMAPYKKGYAVNTVIEFVLEPTSVDSIFRVHFPEGIPVFLRGTGFGYKLYLAIANKLQVILSARNATPEAKAVWVDLLTKPKEFYAFFRKQSAIRGIISTTASDDKIKKTLTAVLDYETKLMDRKQEEASEELKAISENQLIINMLLTNKQFKNSSFVSKLKNTISPLETLKKLKIKTKEPKQVALLNKMIAKAKTYRAKLKAETITNQSRSFQIKDFIDEVTDTEFKTRLEAIYKV